MNTFLIVILIIFAILIGMTIHEFGHFIFAKIFKVNVKEFSIGIGPKLFQTKTKSGMKISLRLLPLMAYVLIDNKKTIKLYSEILDEHIKDEKNVLEKYNKSKLNTSVVKYTFYNWKKNKFYVDLNNYQYMSSINENYFLIDDVSLWKKLIIYFGGVFFNLLAFFLFWIIQYFAFNILNNPFIEIGKSILALLKNMVFMGKGPGTIFGDIANGSGQTNGFQNLTAFGLFSTIFNFLTLFNLMLFIYNLLPIPPLDGYKITIEILQKWFKFEVPRKVEIIITSIGFVILFYIFLSSIIADFINPPKQMTYSY